jgi:hypothetical protein
VDRYTLGHLGFGVMLGLGEVPWWGALGVSLLFEYVLENPMKTMLPWYFPVPTRDSLANSAIDTGAVMLGWYLMRSLPPPPPRRALPQEAA